MGNEEVNIKMTADGDRAVTAIEKIADSFDKLAGKSSAAGGQGSTALESIQSKLAGIAAGMIGPTALLEKYRQVWSQVREEANQAGRSIDASMRSLAVQAARLDSGDRKRVEASAMKYGMTVEQASNVASKLISTGFSADQATGAALDSALATSVATKSEDPAQTAEALSMFLAATKQAKTPENLKRVGIQFQTLFRGTNIQAADIAEIASAAAAESAMGAAPQDIMPMFSLAREVMPGADAKTGLKKAMLALGTARGSQEKVNALDVLGLQPEDVDFHEGNIGMTFGKLKTAADKTGREDRMLAMHSIFGDRGIAAVEAILANLDKLPARLGAGDEAGYNEAVGFATAGVAADKRRADTHKQIAYANRKDWQGKDLVAEELETAMIEQGDGPFDVWQRMQTFKLQKLMVGTRRAAGNQLRDLNTEETGDDALAKHPGLLKAIQSLEDAIREKKEYTINGGGETLSVRVDAQKAGQ